MKASLKLTLERWKQTLWEIKDAVRGRLSTDITNCIVEKMTRAIKDQPMRCTKDVGS